MDYASQMKKELAGEAKKEKPTMQPQKPQQLSPAARMRQEFEQEQAQKAPKPVQQPKEPAPHVMEYQKTIESSFQNADDLSEYARLPEHVRKFAADHYKQVRGIAEISNSGGSDDEKIKKIKQQYPDAKFSKDAEGS